MVSLAVFQITVILILRLSFADMFYFESAVPYYISKFPLQWSAANAYCNKQCHSELATIHNLNDITDLDLKYPGSSDYDVIWIGLHKSNTDSSYVWTENGTIFDPPTEAQGWTEPCIVLSRNDSEWYMEDTSCDDAYPFMCNACDGILNKYVLGPFHTTTQRNASHICDTIYQTSLASIHSQSDYDQIINLCQLYGNHSCWIGLTQDTNLQLQWEDGTEFNFAPNIDHSVQGQCVHIYYNVNLGWELSKALCTQQSYVLCNARSVLCDNKPQIVGNTSGTAISDGCNPYHFGGEGLNMAVMLDTQWVSTDNTIVGETLFSVSTVDGGDGYAGLVIAYSTTAVFNCAYGFIGVILEQDVYRLSVGFVMGDDYTEGESIAISAEEVHKPTWIHINVTSSNWIHVSVNNLSTMSYHVDLIIATLARPSDGRSGYFGVVTNHMTVTVQQLYISGSRVFISPNESPEVNVELTACGHDHDRTVVPTTSAISRHEYNRTVVPDITPTIDDLSPDEYKASTHMFKTVSIALGSVICFALIICAICFGYMRARNGKVHNKKEEVYSLEFTERQANIAKGNESDMEETDSDIELKRKVTESQPGRRVSERAPIELIVDSSPEPEPLDAKALPQKEQSETNEKQRRQPDAIPVNKSDDVEEMEGKRTDGDDGEGYDEVRHWLENTVKLGEYYENFVKNGMNDLDLIQTIEDKEDLEYLGITLKGHQIAIMRKIKQLKPGKEQDMNENVKRMIRETPDGMRKRRSMEVSDIVLEGHQVKRSEEIKEFTPANENDMDDFEEMFVEQEEMRKSSDTNAMKSDQNDTLLQKTTQYNEVQKDKVAFHGTKEDYYDEYHHQKYKDRVKNQDQ
eukprot:565448_1